MGYRIHKTDTSFKVVEANDGEIKDIIESTDENDIRGIQRNLNRGGGFDGWTPDFFLNRFAPSHA